MQDDEIILKMTDSMNPQLQIMKRYHAIGQQRERLFNQKDGSDITEKAIIQTFQDEQNLIEECITHLTKATNVAIEHLLQFAHFALANGTSLGFREVTALINEGKGKATDIKGKSATHPAIEGRIPRNARLSKLAYQGNEFDIDRFQHKNDEKLEGDLKTLISKLREGKDLRELDRLAINITAQDKEGRALYAFENEEGKGFHMGHYPYHKKKKELQIVYKEGAQYFDTITHQEVTTPAGTRLAPVDVLAYVTDIHIKDKEKLLAFLEEEESLLDDPESAYEALSDFCDIITRPAAADVDLQYVGTRHGQAINAINLHNRPSTIGLAENFKDITGGRTDLGFATPFGAITSIALIEETRHDGAIRHASETGQFFIFNAEDITQGTVTHLYQGADGKIKLCLSQNEDELLAVVNDQRKLGYDTLINPMVGWQLNQNNQFEKNADRVLSKTFAEALDKLQKDKTYLGTVMPQQLDAYDPAKPSKPDSHISLIQKTRAAHYKILATTLPKDPKRATSLNQLQTAEFKLMTALGQDWMKAKELVSPSSFKRFTMTQQQRKGSPSLERLPALARRIAAAITNRPEKIIPSLPIVPPAVLINPNKGNSSGKRPG